MAYRAIRPDQLEWITRPHEQGSRRPEPSEPLGFAYVRGNIWRYELGAVGQRHRHAEQEGTFAFSRRVCGWRIPKLKPINTSAASHVTERSHCRRWPAKRIRAR